MTDFAGRVVRPFTRSARRTVPDVAEVARLQVRVDLPDEPSLPDLPSLQRALLEQFTTLRHDLQLSDNVRVAVSAERTRGQNCTFSVDGRPIAIFPAEEIARRTTAEISHACGRSMLRRLSLLAGSGAADQPVASYLLSHGCAPMNDASQPRAMQHAEQIMDARVADEIIVEVPAATLRRVGGTGQQAVVRFREAEYREYGMKYPDIRVEITDHEAGVVQFRFNDVTVAPFHLGADAGWPDVVRQLGIEASSRRHWFLRMRDVSSAIHDDLAYVYPELVRAALAHYPETALTACFREILRNGDRINNIPRLLWLLLGHSDVDDQADMLTLSDPLLLPNFNYDSLAERDPTSLASGVRKVASEDLWRVGNLPELNAAVRLDGVLEDQLVNSSKLEDLASAEWAAVQAIATRADVSAVVTRTVSAIKPVRDALQAVRIPPRVIASQELPPDADIARLEVVGAA